MPQGNIHVFVIFCSFIQVNIQNTFTIEIKNGTHIGHERLKKNAKSTLWIKVEMHIKINNPKGPISWLQDFTRSIANNQAM